MNQLNSLKEIISASDKNLGVNYSQVKLIEEMAELTHPLCKIVNGKKDKQTKEKFIEELAHAQFFIALQIAKLSREEQQGFDSHYNNRRDKLLNKIKYGKDFKNSDGDADSTRRIATLHLQQGKGGLHRY